MSDLLYLVRFLAHHEANLNLCTCDVEKCDGSRGVYNCNKQIIDRLFDAETKSPDESRL